MRKATSCLARERLEAAYAYLLEYPLLGLAVMRQGDEFLLVTGVQVAAVDASQGCKLTLPFTVRLD